MFFYVIEVEKLIEAGANILMPVVVGERGRSAVGTAVDYAYNMFNKVNVVDFDLSF